MVHDFTIHDASVGEAGDHRPPQIDRGAKMSKMDETNFRCETGARQSASKTTCPCACKTSRAELLNSAKAVAERKDKAKAIKPETKNGTILKSCSRMFAVLWIMHFKAK